MAKDYYDKTWKKVLDFCIGFFGTIVIGYLIYILVPIFSGHQELAPQIIIFLEIVAIIVSIKMKRDFLGIGIIATCILPLLLLGACFVSLFRH